MKNKELAEIQACLEEIFKELMIKHGYSVTVAEKVASDAAKILFEILPMIKDLKSIQIACSPKSTGAIAPEQKQEKVWVEDSYDKNGKRVKGHWRKVADLIQCPDHLIQCPDYPLPEG